MTTQYPLHSIPSDIACADDYLRHAQQHLSPAVWAYMAGGAADEHTLTQNTEIFARVKLYNRVLNDLREAHTSHTLFGQTLAHPIWVAPVAYQRLVHPEGERATVLGASAACAGMVLSTQSSTDLDQVAQDAQTPLWFQLYIQPDRAFTQRLIKRAERAGYQALVVTVDAPVNGLRNREQRAGFSLPTGIEAVNLRGMTSVSQAPRAIGQPALLGGPLLEEATRWADLIWLREQTQLPLLLKGITHPEDARRALSMGMDGLILSNHGGRTLDTQPSSLELLPAIRRAIGQHTPLLMDGGIRRGSDVFKALALGANAVLIGRPCIYALATAGALGVAHLIQVLRAELEVTMALTGCRTLDEISPDCLWHNSIL